MSRMLDVGCPITQTVDSNALTCSRAFSVLQGISAYPAEWVKGRHFYHVFWYLLHSVSVVKCVKERPTGEDIFSSVNGFFHKTNVFLKSSAIVTTDGAVSLTGKRFWCMFIVEIARVHKNRWLHGSEARYHSKKGRARSAQSATG